MRLALFASLMLAVMTIPPVAAGDGADVPSADVPVGPGFDEPTLAFLQSLLNFATGLEADPDLCDAIYWDMPFSADCRTNPQDIVDSIRCYVTQILQGGGVDVGPCYGVTGIVCLGFHVDGHKAYVDWQNKELKGAIFGVGFHLVVPGKMGNVGGAGWGYFYGNLSEDAHCV